MEELIKLNEECIRVGKNLCKTLRFNKPLSEKIIQATSFLPANSLMPERVYCLLNNITKIPICKRCPKEVKYQPQKVSYNTYCSTKCLAKDPEIISKRKSTRKPKEFEINKKREDTIALSNNGIRNYSQTVDGRNKIRDSKIELYSDPVRKKETIYKFEQNYQEKTGYRNPAQVPENKEKARQTNQEHFGKDSYLQTDECREAGARASRTPEVKLRKVEGCIRIHGVPNPYMIEKSVKNREKTRFRKMVEKNIKRGYIPKFRIDEYNGVDKKHIYLFTHLDCGSEVKSHLDWDNSPRCLVCYPLQSGRSKMEFDFEKWVISELGFKKDIDFVAPAKKIIDKELDFYFINHGVAIEFNGIYYHSEKFRKDKNYHINKTNYCLKKKIRLIQVFEDEWIEKREVVKSIIKSALKLTDRKIFAKDCVEKIISGSETKAFLNDNHLHGAINKKYNFGLFYKDELVSVLSIGTPREDKTHDFEIIRSCSKINLFIIGGFDKLVNYAVKSLNTQSLISYIDRRYFTGSGYDKNWTLLSTEKVEPRYEYLNVRQGKRENRRNYQKKLIKIKFPEFYNALETEEFMAEKITYKSTGGKDKKLLYRIWNCGVLKFEYKPKGKE